MGLHGKGMAGFVLVFAVFGIAGCGDDTDQERLQLERQAEARREGEQDARQSAELRNLKRQLKEGKGSQSGGTSGGGSSGSASGTAPGISKSPPKSAGVSGYIVILASERQREDAERKAREAGVAVLNSNDYPSSLRPSYWVAYAGPHQSKGEAEETRARHQRQGFSDAYIKYVD